MPIGEAGAALGCIASCLGRGFMITGGSECTPQGTHTLTSSPGSKHCTNQAFDIDPNSVNAVGKKRLFCCARECGVKYIEYEPNPPHYHFQTVPESGSGDLPKAEECCPPNRLD